MGRIVIDKDVCKGCYICMQNCPKHLIKKGNSQNKYGVFPATFCDEKNECIGCAICALSCPDVAIKEVYR